MGWFVIKRESSYQLWICYLSFAGLITTAIQRLKIQNFKRRFFRITIHSKMNLKKIQLRYFPPGINLQIKQQNGKLTNKQINLYGLNLIENQNNLDDFIQQTIFSQGEFSFLSTNKNQITQVVRKIYTKNTQQHKRKFESKFVLKSHKQPLTSCRFSKYGDFFATSSYDRTCKLWQTDTGILINSLSGHQNAIFSIDISQNNNRRLIGTGSLDKTIKIWSVSGKRFHTLIGHDAEVTKVQFNPNGQYILSSSLDGSIKVWDLQKGRSIMDLKGQQNGIVNFSHNYQGDQVICCGFSSVPMIFDLKSGQLTQEMQGQHQGQVTCCKFEFTGESCATAGTDKKCIIWDIGMNQPIEVFQDHTQQILDISFNPHGNLLATASADSTVCIYNSNIGTLQHKLKGHQRQVTKVKFSSQGDYLLSTGFDGIGRIWRADTGENIEVLQGHSDEIFAADVSYYGERIVTCSKDGSCVVWGERKEA